MVTKNLEIYYTNCLYQKRRKLSNYLSLQFKKLEKEGPGMVAHTCNSSTLGGQRRWIMKSGVQDQPGQHDETPYPLKIQKLAGCGGLRR